MNTKIEIYESPDGQMQLDVQMDKQTVWLTQAQMILLFESSKANISEHIKSIFTDKELDKTEATVRRIRTVQQEGTRRVSRELEYYNLDVIISVGYRVNTRRGIQFRQWATARLKDFLVKGYAVNQKRLDELSQMVSIIARTAQDDDLKLNEAKGLLNVLSNYTQSYILLNQYDSNNLKTENLNQNISYEIEYADARLEIDALKEKLISLKEATPLFGNEKDESFKGILGNILQTFGGQYLYGSVEEQAANLLYFVIKNHPFSDGNKRIGAFLFIWFLEKNKHRLNANGQVKVNEYGLVTLALLVAQSDPSDKDLMISLIINLIKN